MDKQTPESIDILIDFHNLRIEPNLSNSARKILKKRDIGRVRRFLEKYSPIIFCNEEELLQIQISDLAVFGKNDEETRDFINLKTGTITLQRYQQKNNKSWFESDDFKEFLKDYQMVHRSIEDWRLDRFHDKSNLWLRDFWYALEKRKLKEKLQRIPYYFVRTGENSEAYHEGYYNLNLVELTEYPYESQIMDCHGIGIFNIGMAIYQGLVSILKKEVIIRRCVVEGCNRIYRVKMRGGSRKMYCRESCRKKKYRLQETDAT